MSDEQWWMYVFGIVAILVILLPAIVEGVCYYFECRKRK